MASSSALDARMVWYWYGNPFIYDLLCCLFVRIFIDFNSLVTCSIPYCIVPWSLLQSSYLFLVSYVYIYTLYLYRCVHVCVCFICTITTKAYTADSSALGKRCACWCALLFFMKHNYIINMPLSIVPWCLLQ
jgi:hypothetical protein